MKKKSLIAYIIIFIICLITVGLYFSYEKKLKQEEEIKIKLANELKLKEEELKKIKEDEEKKVKEEQKYLQNEDDKADKNTENISEESRDKRDSLGKQSNSQQTQNDAQLEERVKAAEKKSY